MWLEGRSPPARRLKSNCFFKNAFLLLSDFNKFPFEKNQSCEAKQFVEGEEDEFLEGFITLLNAVEEVSSLMRLRDLIRRYERSLTSCDEGNWRLFDLQSTVCCCCYRLCDLLEVF